MPTPMTTTTAPGAAGTVDDVTLPPSLALVILWSASQPHRVGEVALFPAFEERFVGRGDSDVRTFARFARQRPGETMPTDPREGARSSHRRP